MQLLSHHRVCTSFWCACTCNKQHIIITHTFYVYFKCMHTNEYYTHSLHFKCTHTNTHSLTHSLTRCRFHWDHSSSKHNLDLHMFSRVCEWKLYTSGPLCLQYRLARRLLQPWSVPHMTITWHEPWIQHDKLRMLDWYTKTTFLEI